MEQIRTILKKWGVNAKNWFNHGHFSDYVLKKGFAYATGKEKSKEVFSLTSKGLLEYEAIKEKLNL